MCSHATPKPEFDCHPAGSDRFRVSDAPPSSSSHTSHSKKNKKEKVRTKRPAPKYVGISRSCLTEEEDTFQHLRGPAVPITEKEKGQAAFLKGFNQAFHSEEFIVGFW